MGASSGATTSAVLSSGRSLRDDVRHHLRDAIFQGKLQPGDRIIESHLARELGVSQAPVREALRELEQMGLVVNHPRRGTTVRRITPQDAWEMYTLRAHLEAMAIRLAVPKLSDEDIAGLNRLIDKMTAAAEAKDRDRLTQLDASFHEFLCERSGHGLLLRTWRSINPLNWTMITVMTLKNRDLTELAERHRPIVKALQSRDAETAERAIRDHVLVLADEVTKGLEGAEHLRSPETS